MFSLSARSNPINTMQSQPEEEGTSVKCFNCDDTGTVCENHPDLPWDTHPISDNFIPRNAKH